MSEEEKKNKQIEEEDEDDSEDDDYMPSDDEEKDNELDESADELDEDENDLNEAKTDDKLVSNKQKLTEDEKKRRADELWADLCSSTSKNVEKNIRKATSSSSSPNKQTSTSNKLTTNDSSIGNSSVSNSTKSDKIKVTKEYDFAGEMIKIEEEIDSSELDSKNLNSSSDSKLTASNNPMKRGLSINSLVANLGKKQKLSTLTKTKLDWDIFKKVEGIEEDLKNHTKNKNSFVERQAFLQRADLKQFELERTVREKNRNLKN